MAPRRARPRRRSEPRLLPPSDYPVSPGSHGPEYDRLRSCFVVVLENAGQIGAHDRGARGRVKGADVNHHSRLAFPRTGDYRSGNEIDTDKSKSFSFALYSAVALFRNDTSHTLRAFAPLASCGTCSGSEVFSRAQAD